MEFNKGEREMSMDKGPWKARMEPGKDMGKFYECKDDVFIESEDFTHDVRLYVNGDFRNSDQKKEYAEEIAAKLNGETNNG